MTNQTADERLDRWDDVNALQHRLMELMSRDPPPEAMDRIVNVVEASIALEKRTNKELVDIALNHFHDLSPVEEQVLNAMCDRLHPGWEKERV